MIFDYAIIGTFILTSILFVILAYLHSFLKKIIIIPETKDLNTFNLNMLVFYFFLAFILLGKLVVILSFPLEINKFSMSVTFLSKPLVFLIIQGLAIAVYIFAIMIIIIQWNLKPAFRYKFLASVLKFILFFASLEFVISLVSYVLLNFDLMFFQKSSITINIFAMSDKFAGLLSVVVLMMLFVCYGLLWLLKHKQKRGVYLLFLLCALFTLLVEVFVALHNFHYLYGNERGELLLNAVFSYPGGFFGWLWFFLILFTPGVIFYSYFLIKLDADFLNIYYARSYSLRLNKLAFLSLLGIGINAVFPGLLIYLIS